MGFWSRYSHLSGVLQSSCGVHELDSSQVKLKTIKQGRCRDTLLMVIQCKGSARLEHLWCEQQITGWSLIRSLTWTLQISSLVPQHLQHRLSQQVPHGSVIFYFLVRTFGIPSEMFLVCHPAMIILYVYSSVMAQHRLVSFIFLISPI